MKSKTILTAAAVFYFSAWLHAAGPAYGEAVDLAIAHGAAPAGWVAPAGTLYSISGNAVTDAQYGIKYDSGKIVTRSLTKSVYSKTDYVGKTYSIYGNPTTDAAWVTTGADVTSFLDNNGGTAANSVKLLERGLGMNDTGTHDMVVEYAVTPTADNIMRPIKNPDISGYSANSADYGDSASFVKPSGMSDAAYANFTAYYNNWYQSALVNKTFPWTQLGYTYFWGNGYTQAEIQGMTEFIILGNTPVDIYGMYATQSYLYTRNDGTTFSAAAGAQYGNGFASFDITGACDTVWAGHRFQKNVKTATANTVTIGSGGVLSGGQGLLIWSLNYDVFNNGVITGATANKFSMAGTANIAVLFEGDTSTSYGTPISGVNRLTNSGTIESPGTAVQALAGNTYIVNNAGGVIGGGNYAILTGSGDDTVTLHGGIVSGNIDLGGGTNSVVVDGATTLSVSLGRASASFAKIANATTATIGNNTLTLASAIGGTANIRDNDSFLIIDAGTLNVSPAAVAVQNDASRPMLTFSAAQSGQQLYLVAARNNSYYAANSGNVSLGEVLDRLANTNSALTDIIGSLDGSGSAAVARQLEPTPQLDALAAADRTQELLTFSIADHMLTARRDKGETAASVWGRAFNYRSHQSALGAGKGYDGNLNGMFGGYEKWVGGSALLGVGAGYSGNSVGGRQNSAHADIAGYHADFYGLLPLGDFYLSGIAGITHNVYDSSRGISVSSAPLTAKARYSGQQYGAYVEGGHADTVSAFSVTERVSLRYDYTHAGAYSESGAASANLDVGAVNSGTLQSGLGIKIAYKPVAEPIFVPQAHFDWLYALVRGNQRVESAFMADGAAFTTDGYCLPRSLFKAGAGFTVNLKKDTVLLLDYDFETQSGYYSHSWAASLKYRF